MRAIACTCVVSAWLVGCAGPTGPQLRADTEDMGPAFGPLQQRQILENVSRMIDDPWAMPGHIDVSSGTLQVQDQAAVDWKLPYTGITAAKAVREFDVSGLQSQEQHSFIISPVSDGDDLRRLHAVYQFAICDNKAAFEYEWRKIIQPYAQAVKVAENANPQFLAQRDLARAQTQYDDALAEDTRLKNRILQLQAKSNLTPTEENECKNDKTREGTLAKELPNLLSRWQQLLENYQKYTKQPAAAGLAAGASPSGGQGQNQNQSGGQQDTIEVQEFKGQMIEQILYGPRWLAWRPIDGVAHYACPRGSAAIVMVDKNDGWRSVGTYGRYELFTNNPEKMSEFMMIAAGSIPNTAGVHNLGSVVLGSTGSNSPATGNMNPVIRFQQF